MGKILINSLIIKNMLGIGEMSIKFPEPERILLVMFQHCYENVSENGNENENANANGNVNEAKCPESPIYLCLQLLCSLKYSSVESLAKINDILNGEVRLKFIYEIDESELESNAAGDDANAKGVASLSDDDDFDEDQPCTSRQALDRERLRKLKQKRKLQEKEAAEKRFKKQQILVIRRFRHFPEHVYYSSNDDALEKISVIDFQKKYFSTIGCVLNLPKNIDDTFDIKWEEFVSNDLNQIFNSTRENPFEIFIQLYMKKHYENSDKKQVMSILNNTCLVGAKSLELRHKQFLILVLNTMRKIFEFMTCDEYTVWYYLTLKDGNLVNYNKINLKELDFTKLETVIQLKKSRNVPYIFWRNCNHDIQDLIHISFQISLAYFWNQCLVFLTISKKMIAEMTLKTTAAAYIVATENENINLIHNNYINRIIEACNKLELAAVIDCQGALVVNPTNGTLLKLKENRDGTWKILQGIQTTNC